MPLTLVPITADQLVVRLAVLRDDYAASVARARALPLAEARAVADDQLRDLLPQGLHTEGMLIWSAEVDGRPVGWVWVALPGASTNNPGQAWVYELMVDADQRGRGYGRAIMRGIERELAGRGVDRLGLNVFGDNVVALRLYESLGFQVTSQQMSKTIDGNRADDRVQ